MNLLKFIRVIDILDAEGAVTERHVAGQGRGAQRHLDGLLVDVLGILAALEDRGDFLAVIDSLVDGEDARAEQFLQLLFNQLHGLLEGLASLAFCHQAIVDVRHGLGEILGPGVGFGKLFFYV